MYGVYHDGPEFTGECLYDLYDYFGSVGYTDGTGNKQFYPMEEWGECFLLTTRTSYTGVSPNSVGEPDYVVGLRLSGDDMVLSHGWEDATYHEDHRWRLGERRSTTYALGESGSWSGDVQRLGVRETLTSLADVKAAVEERLMWVYGRLADAGRSGRLALTWEDMAAMMAHACDYWRREAEDENDIWVDTQGRGAPLELRLTGPENESLFAMRAEHSRSGWVVSETSDFKPVVANGCPWYGHLVFAGDNRSTADWGRCPYPERCDSSHQEPAELLDPWDLKQYVEEWWSRRLDPLWL